MKRKLSDISTISFVVFIDFLLVLNLISSWNSSSPVKIETLKSVSDTIDNVEYIDGGKYESQQIIFTIDSVKYVLYPYNFEHEEFQELFKELKTGYNINLTYKKVLYKYFFRNIIVDLNINRKTIQTIETYNNFHAEMYSYYIILLVLLILGNIIGIACFLLFYNKKFQIFIDKLFFRITDTEAKRIIKKVSKCENVVDFQLLDAEKKDECIRRFNKKGVSIKQISQHTGISKKHIKRIIRRTNQNRNQSGDGYIIEP